MVLNEAFILKTNTQVITVTRLEVVDIPVSPNKHVLAHNGVMVTPLLVDTTKEKAEQLFEHIEFALESLKEESNYASYTKIVDASSLI